jgi:hypothetical protein
MALYRLILGILWSTVERKGGVFRDSPRMTGGVNGSEGVLKGL